jgi:hypothetical protein
VTAGTTILHQRILEKLVPAAWGNSIALATRSSIATLEVLSEGLAQDSGRIQAGMIMGTAADMAFSPAFHLQQSFVSK